MLLFLIDELFNDIKKTVELIRRLNVVEGIIHPVIFLIGIKDGVQNKQWKALERITS